MYANYKHCIHLHIFFIAAYEMYGRTNIMLGVHTASINYVRIHVKGLWSPDSI